MRILTAVFQQKRRNTPGLTSLLTLFFLGIIFLATGCVSRTAVHASAEKVDLDIRNDIGTPPLTGNIAQPTGPVAPTQPAPPPSG